MTAYLENLVYLTILETVLIGHGPVRGCKPEPQKFPSPKIKPCHESIEVDHLAIALEGVVPVQQDVPPCRWRYLGDEREYLGIGARLVLRPRQLHT